MFDKVNISESKKIILVEFNRLASSIISYSYLVNVLSKKYNANVVAYRLTAKKNRIKDFIWKLTKSIISFIRKFTFDIGGKPPPFLYGIFIKRYLEHVLIIFVSCTIKIFTQNSTKK